MSPIYRLSDFLRAARVAVSAARIENPEARGMAGIGYKLPDNSGMLVCDFDSEPFCDDLEALLVACDRMRNYWEIESDESLVETIERTERGFKELALRCNSAEVRAAAAERRLAERDTDPAPADSKEPR